MLKCTSSYLSMLINSTPSMFLGWQYQRKRRMSRMGKRSSGCRACVQTHTRARFTLLNDEYVYYTRVKWLHASDPLMSAIYHRRPEKKSNNIACTATFTRVCAREMARSLVPRARFADVCVHSIFLRRYIPPRFAGSEKFERFFA